MTIGYTPNGITTLTPDAGKAITDGSMVTDSMVFLGINDTPSRWTDCEIPSPEDQTEATEDDLLEALKTLGVST